MFQIIILLLSATVGSILATPSSSSIPCGPLGCDTGPFHTNHAQFKVSTMDTTDQYIDVYYPNTSTTPKLTRQYPLISYAHGLDGGGNIDYIAYKPMLQAIASHGFIVVFPRSCDIGCSFEHCINLPSDPFCFGQFYKEQLKALEWAQNPSNASAKNILNNINHTYGYGIVGHSMGGQATLFSSSYLNASNNNIKAAVMQHAYTHEAPSPTIPFLAFTGSYDTIATPSMTHAFFDAAAKSGKAKHRGYVNKKDASHLEPIVWPQVPSLAKYTVAWLKIYLEKVEGVQDGINYMELIYGNGTDSLCGGGDGEMIECVVTPRAGYRTPLIVPATAKEFKCYSDTNCTNHFHGLKKPYCVVKSNPKGLYDYGTCTHVPPGNGCEQKGVQIIVDPTGCSGAAGLLDEECGIKPFPCEGPGQCTCQANNCVICTHPCDNGDFGPKIDCSDLIYLSRTCWDGKATTKPERKNCTAYK